MIANCSFLKDEQVEILYYIIEKIYDYNYFYNLEEIKEAEQL